MKTTTPTGGRSASAPVSAKAARTAGLVGEVRGDHPPRRRAPSVRELVRHPRGIRGVGQHEPAPRISSAAGSCSGRAGHPRGVEDLLFQRQRHRPAFDTAHVDAGDLGGRVAGIVGQGDGARACPRRASSRSTTSAWQRACRPTSPNTLDRLERDREIADFSGLATVRSGIAAAMLCSAASSMTGWIRKSGCRTASSGTVISVSDEPSGAGRSGSTPRTPVRGAGRSGARWRRSRRATPRCQPALDDALVADGRAIRLRQIRLWRTAWRAGPSRCRTASESPRGRLRPHRDSAAS